jgi:VIT1/CCC1 family predicted Fe2+/Mn2+ transporter
MPSPELLEGYDYVVEGSAARILAMFESEQKHRHEWENRALKTHASSTLLGQVLGFFIAVTVFVSAAVIGIHGNSTTAALIWVFGLAIVVMAGVVWVYAKSMGQRPLFARPAMRTHFRPEKDLDTEGKGVYAERRERTPPS